MTGTGAALFVRALEQYGVTHLFGNPGTTELPVVDALGDSDVEYVLGLHEDVAVGMAAGYAKTHCHRGGDATGVCPVGVVNLHVAPGVAHGLGNVFESSLVGLGAPLVVTGGTHSTDHQHREPNLSGDLVRMTDQFTKWSAEVKTVEALPGMLRRAFRIALTPPTGPVFLALPFDVMTAETDAEPERLGAVPNAGGGDPAQLDAAADAFVEADEPVLIVGDGIARAGRDAVDAAVSFAEAVGARVHPEYRAGELNFPHTHDQWVGELPTDRERGAALFDVDVVGFLGAISNVPTSSADTGFVTEGSTCVQISADARELGKNYPADVAVLGDPGVVVGELLDRLDGRIDAAERDARLERVERVRGAWLDSRTEGADAGDHERTSKAELVAALHAAVPDARVVAEAVTSRAALVANRGRPADGDLEVEQDSSWRGGSLGHGVAAAIGAAIAERERPAPRDVVGFVGDGSFLYYPHAVYSAARYDVDVTIVVADNRNYRILKDNMVALLGGSLDDYDFESVEIDPPVDIAGTAAQFGASGRLVADPDDVRAAIASAVAEPGPSVLDVLVHD
jgi:benzoylformate decarboxylase